jgi:hypothetical protein
MGLIGHYFGIKISNLYQGGDNSLSLQNGEIIGDYFEDYEIPGYPKRKMRRLAHHSKLILTQALREELAAEDNCYVIKTHELPYKRYFDGEFSIHIVRHPMPVTWSYLRFMKEVEGQKVALDELLYSRGFANWNTHTMTWLETGRKLRSQYLLLRYEDLGQNYQKFIEEFKAISRMDPIRETEYPDFAIFHKKNPAMYRVGNNQDWVEVLTLEEIAKIWLNYSAGMNAMGYDLSSVDIDTKKLETVRASHQLSQKSQEFKELIFRVSTGLVREAQRLIKDQDLTILSLREELQNKNSGAKADTASNEKTKPN